jgi:polyhydroxyalkanoate synthesis repressor PhaR
MLIRMALIKRYPNRKLYDTDAKKYVTLDEIGVMVRSGTEVQVIDHESGEDVTSLTLTQIILEQEKKKSGYLSTSALAGLIRSGGSTLTNSIGDTLDTFRKSVQKGVASLGEIKPMSEDRINRLIEQGKLNMEQVQGLLKLDDLLADVLHSLNVPSQQEIQALQKQIEALSARLADLSDEENGSADTEAAKAVPHDSLDQGNEKLSSDLDIEIDPGREDSTTMA